MLGGVDITEQARAHAREMLARTAPVEANLKRKRAARDAPLNAPGRSRPLETPGVGRLLDVGPLLTGAVGLAAMPVENQRVIADFEPQALRDRVLALFDPAVHELFDTAAVHTHDVIVVRALVSSNTAMPPSK